METVVAQTRMKTALRSKPPPEKKYRILRNDDVKPYREKPKCWHGPFTFIKVSDKIISVTDGSNVEPFIITAIITMALAANDTYLKQDMRQMKIKYLTRQDETNSHRK